MDSPYRGPVTRKIIPFDDIIMLCVFNLGAERFSGYVRHPNEQCHLSHGSELMIVTSVKHFEIISNFSNINVVFTQVCFGIEVVIFFVK